MEGHSRAERAPSRIADWVQHVIALTIGNIHRGIIAGKLNGQMPAVTPSGTRHDVMSMSVATDGELSPIVRDGTPMAYSTT